MKRSRWLLLCLVTIFLVGLIATPSSAAKVLAFSTQPADAVKNQTITTLDLDALDGTINGSFVQVVAEQNVRVTVTSVPSGVSRTVRAGADGVATFSNLSIGTPGTYTLTASAGGGWDSATSNSFRVFDSGEACGGSNATCDPVTGNLNANNETAKVSGNSNGDGVVGVALNIESAPVCPGDNETEFNHGPGVLSAFWDNIAGEVVITLTISKAWDQLQPRNGASFYQVCFTYDQPGKTFTDKFGSVVETGLLPDCGPQTGVPCIQSRSKNNKGNVVIVVRSPVDAKCR